MFGIMRRRATNDAIQATYPIVRTLEMRGPLPSIFWLDPYILGYFYMTIGLFAKTSSSNKLVGADMGRCLIETFTTISQKNGGEIVEHCNNLVMGGDKDFQAGIRDAQKVVNLTFGSREFDHDSDVLEATKLADAMANPQDPLVPKDRLTRIVSCLQMKIYERMRGRFR